MATEAISCVKFNPITNLIALTTWSNDVSIYKYKTNINENSTQLISSIDTRYHSRAVLSCCWHPSGSKLFSAGFDTTIRIWNISQSTNCKSNYSSFQIIGYHDASINFLEYAKQYNLLISSSWDKTIKFWDIRSQSNTKKSVFKIDHPNKIYTMTQKRNMIVVGLSDLNVYVYDIRKCSKYIYRGQTKIKSQFRSMSMIPNAYGFVITSIKGTAAVYYFKNLDTNSTDKLQRGWAWSLIVVYISSNILVINNWWR